jgi:hypothetical protein
LASSAVEGDHELAPSPFAEWFLSDGTLELRDKLRPFSGCQLRVDPTLDRGPPELVEALSLRRAEPRIPEALIRGPTPQLERLLEPCTSLVEPTGVDELTSFRSKVFEADRVDRI